MKNNVSLIGRIGTLNFKDFENGSTVCNISLAVEDNYLDKNKERVERTQWIDLVGQNKVADQLHSKFKKGDQLAVIGKLRKRSFEKNGQEIFITEVLVRQVEYFACKTK